MSDRLECPECGDEHDVDDCGKQFLDGETRAYAPTCPECGFRYEVLL
jgi:DNA-directed RNA polymerase subunit RPC12/RpoP